MSYGVWLACLRLYCAGGPREPLVTLLDSAL